MNYIKLEFIVVVVFLLLGAVLPTKLKAQSETGSEDLSLSQAEEMALQNNKEILKALSQVEAAKGDHQQSLAAFLPAIELSSGFTRSNDPLYAFGFKLQQQAVTMADFDPAVINNPGETNHFNTQILVEQPLINADAWVGRSAAGRKVKAMELQAAFTKDNINFMVKQTYFALQLANSRVHVLQKAQTTTNQYLKLAKDNQDQGYMKEADVLAIEVRKNEIDAQIIEAKNQIINIKETLNFLMGRELSLPIVVSDSIKQVAFELAGASSVTNRSDVLAMKYGMEAYKSKAKSDLLKFAPRLNAFGTYNTYDADFGAADVNSWMVGIKLQWRIFNGGRNMGMHKRSKAEYISAQYDYQSYVDKENIELTQATRNITVAQSQLLTYQTASSQAQESFRIRLDRYEQGMERTADLLMAETKVAETALQQLNAVYNYNMAVFKYELLSSQAN